MLAAAFLEFPSVVVARHAMYLLHVKEGDFINNEISVSLTPNTTKQNAVFRSL